MIVTVYLNKKKSAFRFVLKQCHLFLICIFLSILFFNKINAQFICPSQTLIGSSFNVSNNTLSRTNAIAVDQALNTIVFIHRNDVSMWGGGASASGILRYDISTNGGSSWTNHLGPLNPLYVNPARYPQVAIYNPPGNTNPSNAYLSYFAPTIATPLWNGYVSGVHKLDGTGNTEHYNQPASTETLIPGSMCKGEPGVFWAMDYIYNGAIITGYRVYKGVWIGGISDVVWTTNYTITPSFNVTYDGNPHFADFSIAFDPTGQKGWISMLTHLNGGPTAYAYYPVFYKTIDGGNTWTGPIQVDPGQFNWITDNINPGNVPTTAFESDLVVDVNGNPHLLTTICNGLNNYSLIFNQWHHMVDFTNQAGVWNALDVANVKAGRASWVDPISGNESVHMDMFPMISRTTDGSKIFFAWTDNSSYSLGAANTSPNLFSRAFDPVNQTWTTTTDFTSCNPATNGKYIFPKLATEVLEPAAGEYKMISAYSQMTNNDPTLVTNFLFLNNVKWKNTDFSNLACSVTLSSAAGTNAQTKCINTAITNINYTTAIATGATFSGLPSGITGNWASNVITISGSPTDTGTFNYTVTLTGGNCNNITTGSIIVTLPPVASANPSTQTLICPGAIIPIVLSGNLSGTTFTWTRDNTVAVTGIAASGSGNISGSLNNTTNSTVLVTFTITPAANGCSGTPITATVTVNPAPAPAGTAGGPVVTQTLNVTPSGVSFIQTGTCNVIARLIPSGTSPVSGNVTAKVWVKNSVPLYGSLPYVARHYEMQPATNSSTATGTVTLYFSQAEFDAFNTHAASVLDLPTGPVDATGKANLRIYKYPGTSSDGSGLPYTYNDTTLLINPADGNIIWNSTYNWWEVTFDITGFSGFTVGTANTLNFCPNGSFIIPAGATGGTYQWQLDNGTGYVNISNGPDYSGVTTATLKLITLPTNFYGYKYRCLVNGVPSTVYDVKFVVVWQGNTNIAWHIATNWASCSIAPDQYTDVVIPSGRVNYPGVYINTTIRSLRNDNGSAINVQPGIQLNIIGH